MFYLLNDRNLRPISKDVYQSKGTFMKQIDNFQATCYVCCFGEEPRKISKVSTLKYLVKEKKLSENDFMAGDILSWSCRHGHLKVIQFLHEEFRLFRWLFNKNIIKLAIKGHHVTILEYLMNVIKVPKTEFEFDIDCWKSCIMTGNLKMVKFILLFHTNFKVDRDMIVPLVESDNFEMLQLLLMYDSSFQESCRDIKSNNIGIRKLLDHESTVYSFTDSLLLPQFCNKENIFSHLSLSDSKIYEIIIPSPANIYEIYDRNFLVSGDVLVRPLKLKKVTTYKRLLSDGFGTEELFHSYYLLNWLINHGKIEVLRFLHEQLNIKDHLVENYEITYTKHWSKVIKFLQEIEMDKSSLFRCLVVCVVYDGDHKEVVELAQMLGYHDAVNYNDPGDVIKCLDFIDKIDKDLLDIDSINVITKMIEENETFMQMLRDAKIEPEPDNYVALFLNIWMMNDSGLMDILNNFIDTEDVIEELVKKACKNHNFSCLKFLHETAKVNFNKLNISDEIMQLSRDGETEMVDYLFTILPTSPCYRFASNAYAEGALMVADVRMYLKQIDAFSNKLEGSKYFITASLIESGVTESGYVIDKMIKIKTCHELYKAETYEFMLSIGITTRMILEDEHFIKNIISKGNYNMVLFAYEKLKMSQWHFRKFIKFPYKNPITKCLKRGCVNVVEFLHSNNIITNVDLEYAVRELKFLPSESRVFLNRCFGRGTMITHCYLSGVDPYHKLDFILSNKTTPFEYYGKDK